jgi:predicted small secreted protein
LNAGIIRQADPRCLTDPECPPPYDIPALQRRRQQPVRVDPNFESQENIMKTLFTLLMSSVFVVLAGCNTVAGAGKDIERGGEKVQDTARDVQQKM